MTEEMPTIYVGSRKSELALIQTNHVISCLQKLYPNQKFEIREMTTKGDRILNISLPKIGEKALFTKDLEDALIKGAVDFVVHSLKDLPTELPKGMTIGAVLQREDPEDALVLREEFIGKTLATLPAGSVIGTSSLRRRAQINRYYKHLKVDDIRGNLNTRLAKLDCENSKYAGIILAKAGLIRMGIKWQKRINQVIDSHDLLYAVGQGALAVECRSNDEKILKMLQQLCCLKTICKILAERSFLKTLQGGCSAPVAVITELAETKLDNLNIQLNIFGAVWSLDGTTEIKNKSHCILLNFNKNIDDNDDNAAIDEIDNFIIPNKRIKMIDENATAQLETTATPSSSSSWNKQIIDVHSDIVTNCPMNLPVGQDIMAQCPISNEDQQVLLEKFHKVTENNSGKVEKNTELLFMEAAAAASSSIPGAIQKCPFLHSKLKTASPPPPEPLNTDGDDVANKKTNEQEEEMKKSPSPCTIELFCGLYRHDCYPLEWFNQCEELGRQLAKELIKNNALEVMSKAKEEIHKK